MSDSIIGMYSLPLAAEINNMKVLGQNPKTIPQFAAIALLAPLLNFDQCQSACPLAVVLAYK